MSDINKWNTIVRWNNVIAIEQETLKHRSTEWVRASDHDRLMKEKDAEIERLKRERAKYEADCKRIEYFDDLHEKVATQARVIEKLKERLTSWISETHPNDEHLRNMCLMVEERELAAIEKGEA